MMPIVFWASLAPCPRLNAAADTSCSTRKLRSTVRGRRLRCTSHMIPMISTKASARPIKGEYTMNTPMVWRPSKITASQPALATAAPTSPPTRACDDDEGRPR